MHSGSWGAFVSKEAHCLTVVGLSQRRMTLPNKILRQVGDGGFDLVRRRSKTKNWGMEFDLVLLLDLPPKELYLALLGICLLEEKHRTAPKLSG